MKACFAGNNFLIHRIFAENRIPVTPGFIGITKLKEGAPVFLSIKISLRSIHSRNDFARSLRPSKGKGAFFIWCLRKYLPADGYSGNGPSINPDECRDTRGPENKGTSSVPDEGREIIEMAPLFLSKSPK